MKKLIAILLVLALVLPACAVAEKNIAKKKYTPALGMTMVEFISKYNAVKAPIGSSYLVLDKPYLWTDGDEYSFAWFKTESKSSVVLFLVTTDPNHKRSLDAGLDMIQIYDATGKDFLALISISDRCSELFALQWLGTSFGGLAITTIIRGYYENGQMENGGGWQCFLDEENKYAIQFFYQDGYYFMIYVEDNT